MSYLLTKTSANSFTLNLSAGYTKNTALAIKIQKITPTTHILAAVSSTVIPAADVAYNAVTGLTCFYTEDIYTISLPDGVYKISIMDGGYDTTALLPAFVPTNIHFFISKATMDTYMKASIQHVLCCNPLELCRCKTKCNNYYDMTVLGLLSLSFFGETDIDLRMDFYPISGGPAIPNLPFVVGYEYYATTGAAGVDFTNAGGVPLLRTQSYVFITTTVVTGVTYVCVESGIATDITGAVFTPITANFLTKLYNIADALSRVSKYIDGCNNSSSSCSCS